MNSLITLAVIASISLRSVHAAAIIARATARPVTRSRGRRFARGLIAAIVIPSLIGLGLLVLCCFCLTRLLKRRRNARGTTATDQMYPSGPASALPMQSNGMNYGPPGAVGHGYGPHPPQAYLPGRMPDHFVGGFAHHAGPPPHY